MPSSVHTSAIVTVTGAGATATCIMLLGDGDKREAYEAAITRVVTRAKHVAGRRRRRRRRRCGRRRLRHAPTDRLRCRLSCAAHPTRECQAPRLIALRFLRALRLPTYTGSACTCSIGEMCQLLLLRPLALARVFCSPRRRQTPPLSSLGPQRLTATLAPTL